MEEKNIKYDCSRGCITERTEQQELIVTYRPGCCKLKDFDWLSKIHDPAFGNYYEVRFKNTRKGFYENTSGQLLKQGDLVVVEAATGHDVGIITLSGPVVYRQMLRCHSTPGTKEFRKIYRKAKPLDLERWQEAIARENQTMIRARAIAQELNLDMKIGDVEFQGDGSKAIFYYIADERVDFRQLIKVFAEEFRIRIEMKQIGARQEAGLIGGVGVCGRELCCAKFITNFQSISTHAARCQDLSLNPQKLAGQCGKLKCCINYEAPIYIDAHKTIPHVSGPLDLIDGNAYLVKTDTLKGIMWFTYQEGNMSSMIPVPASEVKHILHENKSGRKGPSIQKDSSKEENVDFVAAIGDDKIDRFDEKKKKSKKKKKNPNSPKKESVQKDEK
ncbi:MAG: regulatory iron-sulfur-containing complex subunit RicT [Candidatus Coprenecus sp.]|nr:regulatory iron-sulfur-containing complex subunit RicT [Candidatus Coprenecus sp.]